MKQTYSDPMEFNVTNCNKPNLNKNKKKQKKFNSENPTPKKKMLWMWQKKLFLKKLSFQLQ